MISCDRARGFDYYSVGNIVLAGVPFVDEPSSDVYDAELCPGEPVGYASIVGIYFEDNDPCVAPSYGLLSVAGAFGYCKYGLRGG